MIQIMTDQDLSVQAVDSYKTTVRQKKKAAKTVLPPIEARLAAADYGNDASPPSSRSYRHFGAQRGEEKIRVRYPYPLVQAAPLRLRPLQHKRRSRWVAIAGFHSSVCLPSHAPTKPPRIKKRVNKKKGYNKTKRFGGKKNMKLEKKQDSKFCSSFGAVLSSIAAVSEQTACRQRRKVA